MRFCQPTKKQEQGYRRFVSKLPAKARVVAQRFDPWTLYRLRDTGDRVIVRSFSDEGLLTVTVSGYFNLVLFERDVFGIHPSELEECDLPTVDEPVGVTAPEMTLDEARVVIRPDLWVMQDGKAVRKQ